MKLALLFSLISVIVAAPQSADKDATVLKYNSDNSGIDGYNFDFETSNGIAQQEEGKLTNQGTENELMKVSGSYTFTWEGITYKVTYTADENGFQPVGDHIPK
ncbi:flexible cuticle protein 12-like [Diorhabda carinulata]|uniref:flexible cuticle protein 12-like n=1 Tax=Diorhabda carinulata TaxID=1163345 RepID=UPI0025A1DFEB|nr:flexible cuticle protein 12-like [Diorhabda carinulata]